jgi:hypothetical protein
MHEITFSTDDKPKLLSQVWDSFSYQNLIYILKLPIPKQVAQIWSPSLLVLYIIETHG